MNYVTAIITSFAGSNVDDVILKARGRSIRTAVDAAEITRRRFMKDLNIGTVNIGTEEIRQEGGETRNVSTIEITLTRSIPETKKGGEGTTKTEAVSIHTPRLTSIAGVGLKRAEELKAQGIHSVHDLAKLDPKKLSKKLQISEKRVSKWVDEAKEILNK